jgi:hypothetical protein
MIIDQNKINWGNIQEGVSKYIWIMKYIDDAKLKNKDISKDEVFRKKFNGFYVMGRKTEKYYDFYYTLLNTKIRNNSNFLEILEQLYTIQNNFESSFSSKLLHTMNPNFPIWDSIVMQNLDLIIKKYPKDSTEKKEAIIKQYEKLSNFYVKFILTPEGQVLINLFDDKIDTQDYNITPLKKIDFIIWQTR